MNRLFAHVLMLAMIAIWQPSHLHAQRTRLVVTGFPVNFPAPTGSDFDIGSIASATGITFTVDALRGTTSQRTAIVSIRCAAPCPRTGSKPVSQLSWRRADLLTWNALSTTDAVIEARPMFRGQPLPASNDPWTNTLYFRFTLGWLTDPPAVTQNQYNIIMTLTVTVP